MKNKDKRYCTIYLVRHGESVENAHYAKSENPLPLNKLGTDLSASGVQQIKHLSQKLYPVHFDAIFSSDFIRAKRTAEIIAFERNLKISTTKLIRERGYGRMTGKMTNSVHEEIKKLQKGLTDKEKMKIKLVQDMENEEEMLSRFIIFLREIATAYSGKAVLVVNHEHMMRILLIHTGFAKYDDLPAGSIDNTGYIKLVTDGVDFFVKETWRINKKSVSARCLLSSR